jgi:hypothetical protein
MYLIIKEPLSQEDRHLRVKKPNGRTLQQLLGPHGAQVQHCLVDREGQEDWPALVPRDERIELFLKAREPISGSLVTALIVAAISTALSVGISFLMRALADDPAENTVSLGTPKFLVYGERRVFGHIIATKTAIGSDGTSTTYGALYFMGEGPIEE